MKQRKVRLALFATFVLLCLIAAVPSFASQARIVRLSQIDGDVQIDRGGLGLEKAVMNMPVIEGTRIVAGDDATAEVEFENGSTLRIVGPATVNFRELSLRSEGDRVSLIDLQPGIYYFDIKHKGEDDFRVGVASDTLRLRKSAHFRVQAANDGAKIAVYSGEIKLDGSDREATIKSNETVALDPADPGRYFLAKGIDSLFSDSWDHERAEYRERYADAQTWKYANNQYGSSNSYGFSDLNYYGSYFDVPGWGWMWRPSAYDLSWDPFSNGAWSYYPGQGWMFVSMYPWGWAPYRYGQWNWVPGYGWCWRPGTNYSRWYPVPPVQNYPGTWHRPHPPVAGDNRTVFVNPAPPMPNGPVHTWRRPSGVTPAGTQGFNSDKGVPAPSGTATAPGGTWRRGDATGIQGGTVTNRPQGSTAPTQPPTVVQPPQGSQGNASDARQGTWRRVTPPAEVQKAPSAPPIQVQPAPQPQRNSNPAPQRHVEPMHQPRSAPAPSPRVEPSPGKGAGAWVHSSGAAPSGHRK